MENIIFICCVYAMIGYAHTQKKHFNYSEQSKRKCVLFIIVIFFISLLLIYKVIVNAIHIVSLLYIPALVWLVCLLLYVIKKRP